ncbi:hypothetical protein Tcan_05779 [Toxocara canis]|uniref:Uncharacterized protein n=1 Tax=Toxocara canis TaxID=6265 RepID=A0A0B2VZ10_TOXCA|nr:hypothetical protein Tcan_05779 [Toxocara canis]
MQTDAQMQNKISVQSFSAISYGDNHLIRRNGCLLISLSARFSAYTQAVQMKLMHLEAYAFLVFLAHKRLRWIFRSCVTNLVLKENGSLDWAAKRTHCCMEWHGRTASVEMHGLAENNFLGPSILFTVSKLWRNVVLMAALTRKKFSSLASKSCDGYVDKAVLL